MKSYILSLALAIPSLLGIYSIEAKDCGKKCENKCVSCEPRCSNKSLSCGTSIFIPRSVGANTARELVGWQDQLFRPYCENFAPVSGTVEVTHSFDHKQLAHHLLCTDCLTFAGSQSKHRKDSDIIADYFGLPTDFLGSLRIKPSIKNYIVDLQAYIDLNEVMNGLYFRFHAPITHTRFNLGLDECVACEPKFRGHDVFPTGYMFSTVSSSNTTVPLPTLPSDCFFNTEANVELHRNNNCVTHSLRKALSGDFLFGDMSHKWKYGKFSFCTLEKLRLADIDLIAGYNFFRSDWGHFGIYAQAVVPTGNRPNAKHFFEPIVGNAKHWELGAGLSGHFMFCDDGFANGSHIGFYYEGNVTHMFKNHQKRSFDFKDNGFLSRYMLLKEYDINDNYTGRMINAINFCTRRAIVHVPVKVDFSAKLYAGAMGWMFDLGYNFYFRDAEKVCIDTHCPCEIDQKRWGIKGTQGVAYLESNITNNIVTVTGTPTLNATDPKANMFTVSTVKTKNYTNKEETGIPLAYNNNLVYDNYSITIDEPLPAKDPLHLYVANPSTTPKIISCADLDINSAVQPRMITHKVFGHIGYQWYEHEYNPHVGIGAEVEFARYKDRGVNQFGVWIKAGTLF